MALTDNGNGLSAADVAAVVGNNGGASMKESVSNEADRGAIQECINKLKA